VLGTPVAELHFSAHSSKKLACCLDVSNLWDVFENNGFVGKQSSRDTRQSRVFRAADADSAKQWLTAPDDEFVHEWVPVLYCSGEEQFRLRVLLIVRIRTTVDC
jgi:hypothetical protein